MRGSGLSVNDWVVPLLGGTLAAVMAVLLLAAFSGCRAGSGSTVPVAAPSIDTASTDGDIPTRTVALAVALEDLQALDPPGDVDAALFASLKDELRCVLRDLYGGDPVAREARRQLAAIEPADANRAWCLQGMRSASGEVTIKWYGRHVGDYNLDGLVGVADLTPLGFHFDAAVELDDIGLPVRNGDNEWVAQVDGDQNGLISVSDITPIGVNYDSRLLGYRVYLGSSSDGQTIDWDDDYLPCADDAGAPYTVAYNTSRATGEVHQYTHVFGQPPIPENAVLHAKVVAYDATAEGRETTISLPAGPHQALSCELCHRVTDLEYYGDDQTCLLCHSRPPENDSLDWDDTPGLHNMCMACHAEHSFAVLPPESGCGVCHSGIVTEATAAGMPDCMGCHEAGHLPNAQPSVGTCVSCHPTPPEDNQAAWDSTPALHDQCNGCHVSHGFAITPPESVCGDCHADLITAGHAGGSALCLDCHTYPHLPNTDISGQECQSCHTVPPEDPSAFWGDAPGLHDRCELCHDDADHGDKPIPPESICGDCHDNVIALGHAGGATLCTNCHTYPHLPEAHLSPSDCVICHTEPPEDLAAEWEDAPGQHAICEQCHDISDHGDKPVPPQSVCGNCHSDLITGGHAWGRTVCRDCHSYAHLPISDFSGWQCADCHLTPPEDPEATWNDAPGQHRQCSMCHNANHGDKPVPPESICGDCHGDVISAGHAWGSSQCLSCHTWPHLPVSDFSAWSCIDCHTAPPEDLEASWDDAPGQHDQCGLCHDEANHGDKPIPPQSICTSCHDDVGGGGHPGPGANCMMCHTYAHLPVMP